MLVIVQHDVRLKLDPAYGAFTRPACYGRGIIA